MPTPGENETKDEFIPRCVPIVIKEGTAKDNEQAVAICNSMWKDHLQKHAETTLPVEVMSVGVWNNTKFTIDDLNEMVANFNQLKSTIKPPIKLGHTPDKPGMPAYGWVENLKVVGNKLVAYVTDIPEKLMNAIKAKRYRRVSSEIYFGYTYNGKKYGKVFSALALLGADIPAVKDLDDLQAYLYQNADTVGTFDEVGVFTAPVDLNAEVLNENKEIEDMDLKEMEKQLAEFAEKLAALTQENTDLKTKNASLEQEKAEAQKAAFAEKQTKAKDDFKEYCETKVKEGSLLPAQRDILIGKQNFTEDNEMTFTADQIKEVINLSEKVLEKKQVVEENQVNKVFDDVQDEVTHKVKEYMDANKVNYADAFSAVMDADQDLANRYRPSYYNQ